MLATSFHSIGRQERMHGEVSAMTILAPIGSCIAERFVIESHAGTGGMGAVYRAHDKRTGHPIALKLLQRDGNPEFAERFAREARVLSELRHPSIVAYLAHGETEEGAPYLAMEWLDGEDLAGRLSRGPLPIAEALILLRQAAEALAVAHARGWVHRDLKPGNIFLRGGNVERLALIDFGITRRNTASQMVTSTGAIIGTPAYMAPEQARGERPISAAADIFSLGCVMFECISGKPPFAAAHVLAILAKVLFEEPPPLHHVCPGAPETIAALLARMLSKRAEDRYKDAAALLTALDSLDEITPGAVRPSPIAGGEQQLLCIVMATTPASASLIMAGDSPLKQSRPHPAHPISTLPVSLSTTIAAPALASLRRELEGLGANLEVLAEGSLVVTLRNTGAAVTDQATRAARCAILIKAHWPEALIALGTGLGLRHDRAMTGEAFDRAAALLRHHSDEFGSDRILIDEVTRGLLDMRFVIDRAPSGVYLLTGDELSLDATRPLLGKPTPCVGRDIEFAMLEGALSTCIEEAEPCAIVVTAPPGMGKSRLRHEFVRRISARGDDVFVVIGRGDPLSVGVPYGLLGQAIRRLCGILDGESLESRRAKLAKRIGVGLPEERSARVVTFIGELAGVPFPDEHDVRLRAARQDPLLMSDQITEAALDFLRAECAMRPMLLVLEDLHWSDALTVKLCGTALHKLSGYPLMVLAVARPEVDERFPGLWSKAMHVVRLKPLGRKAGERLAQQVLGQQVSPEAVAKIVAQSEGNALLLEELIRAAAEGRGDEASGTVLAMMQARIGRLPASARRVLRVSSVFGEIAEKGGIQALLGASMSNQEIEGWLTRLLEDEILEERSESQFPGEKSYRFRHALVRDAAYSLSSEDERVASHRLAGEYLESRGESDSLVLATHFGRGREPRRAAPYYLRAGEESLEANDTATALSSVERGLACGTEGELRGALLSLKIAAHWWREQFDEVIALSAEALALLPEGSMRWCRSLRYVCVAAATLQRIELLVELASRFARGEPNADARGEYVQGAAWFAMTFAITGPKEACRMFQARAWQAGADIGQSDMLSWGYLNSLNATIGFAVEEAPWSSMTYFTEAQAALRAVDEKRFYLMQRAFRGRELHDLGDFAGAEAELREAHAQAVRLGEAVPLTYVKMCFARFLARAAPIDGLDEAEEIARGVISAKNPMFSGDAQCAVAEIRRRQGNLVDAEREARAACETVRPFQGFAWGIIALHARILLEQGRAEEALAVAEAGVQELEQRGIEASGEIELRLSRAEALHAVRRGEAARAALADTLPRLKKRVDDIPESSARERYLTRVPANARVIALAKEWLGEDAGAWQQPRNVSL
ncbi:MAG: protein kinase [Polyangiaceae bacterium]|nr:protein kinase [Polyangiaceae bacterium]